MGIERRRNTRHPIILDITLGLHGTAPRANGRSVDVSNTGIFIMTDAIFPEGKRVDLIIEGGDGHAPLLTSGMVVHSVGELGIGVRFSEQTDAARKRLQQLIDSFYTTENDTIDDDEDTVQTVAPAGLAMDAEKSDRALIRKR